MAPEASPNSTSRLRKRDSRGNSGESGPLLAGQTAKVRGETGTCRCGCRCPPAARAGRPAADQRVGNLQAVAKRPLLADVEAVSAPFQFQDQVPEPGSSARGHGGETSNRCRAVSGIGERRPRRCATNGRADAIDEWGEIPLRCGSSRRRYLITPHMSLVDPPPPHPPHVSGGTACRYGESCAQVIMTLGGMRWRYAAAAGRELTRAGALGKKESDPEVRERARLLTPRLSTHRWGPITPSALRGECSSRYPPARSAATGVRALGVRLRMRSELGEDEVRARR